MISTTNWVITISALAIIIVIDFIWAITNRHKDTSMREVTLWSLFYVSLAIAFGIHMGYWLDPQSQKEFFAGWLTEYSLSFDNLFVFVIILAKLKISREKQQLALLIGILFALVLRVIAISVGAKVIEQFQQVFFLFGAFLIYTAIQLFRESGSHDEEEEQESKLITYLTAKGIKPFTIALITLGLTDLIFALDSIPAIFGLTQNVYIVITANVFALMGLRQLYFLIGGLMQRLVHIGKGLSVVLGFIGVKLIFHAFHGVDIHEIAGIHIPEITITQSLTVIVSCLGLATITSLISTRDKKELQQ
jgi:tellurite resistance protein TerC